MSRRSATGALVLVMLAGTMPVSAGYDANMTGVIESVLTYSDASYVLFRLQNQPTSHPSCNPYYFALSDSLPGDRLSRLTARLLTAYALGETITIGYDSLGNCAHTFIRGHRVG